MLEGFETFSPLWESPDITDSARILRAKAEPQTGNLQSRARFRRDYLPPQAIGPMIYRKGRKANSYGKGRSDDVQLLVLEAV